MQAKCHEEQPKQPNSNGKHQQHNNNKGTMDEVLVLEEAYDVQHNDVDFQTTTIEPDPDEIHFDDGAVTCHMEAYSILHFPVDGQCIGSICVEVDTGAGGNIVPLCVF